MFFRAKDTKYKIEGVEGEFVASEDHWIIQWEGYPDYDSGYAEYLFASASEANREF